MIKGRVLVTGANGFIGQALCRAMHHSGFNLRAAVRQKDNRLPTEYEVIESGDVGPETDWQKELIGVDTVVHLSGKAHILKDTSDDLLSAFRRINVMGTEQLARMAVKAGVRRFIFISSIKVNGEGGSRPYTENDAPDPRDAYAISKREAEDSLAHMAAQTGLQVVVLRLPLVYGPGVKANFKNLIKIVNSGVPLPFSGINNRRSFVYLDNLVSAIITCVTHPLATGEIFMVSDGQDISTPDLIKMIAFSMNKKPGLFYLHPRILKALCKIVGKSKEEEKMTGTLLVDSSKIRNLLNWKTPFSLEEGIKETVKL